MTGEVLQNEALAFMGEIAVKAAAAAMGFFRGKLQVERKNADLNPIDIVTNADRASETIILQAIRERFPDHDIMSEETDVERTGSPYLWLVDPLDGTVNFAHGYPVFSISMALMHEGTLIAGLVHDPTRGETFSAARGDGAELNGEPISVSHADGLERSLVATGFPYDRAVSADNNLKEFASVMPRVQGIRRAGSAALDLAHVAAGRLDGFWELKLKPWDMAAGILLVKEAGGRVSDRSGGTADVYTDCIVATNGLIHDSLLDLIRLAD